MRSKIVFYIFVLALFFNSFSNLFSFIFLATSDLHVDFILNSNYRDKKKQLPAMINFANKSQNNVRAVLFVGDLTDCGSYFQYQKFLKKYYLPFANLGINVHLCQGNHDWCYAKSKIPKRYSFKNSGLNFICCGVFPSNKASTSCCTGVQKISTLSWLQGKLQEIGSNDPVVMFFHYNLIGTGSNDWSLNKKEAFYQVIKGYNVICIFTGHCHKSYYTRHWKDILVVGVGGKCFVIVEYMDKKLEIKFMDRHENESGLMDLYNNYWE